MIGKSTKMVSAIFAVALMIMVAFAPIAAIIADDGSDAAFTTGAFTVNVKDKAGAAISANNKIEITSAVITDNNNGTYTVPEAFISGLVIAAGVLKATDKSMKLVITDKTESVFKYTFDEVVVDGDSISANTVDAVAKEFTVSGTTGAAVADVVVSVSGTTTGVVKSISDGTFAFAVAANSNVDVTVNTQKVGSSNFTYFGQKASFTKVIANYTSSQYAELAFTPNEIANTGSVVDAASSGIANATVSYVVNGVSGQTTTNNTGGYTIYVNAGGNFALTGVTATGYTFTPADITAIKHSGVTSPVTIANVVAKEFTASGTFQTSNSTPVLIEGASITLGVGSSTTGVVVTKIDNTTKSDGTFKFTYLIPAGASTSQVVITLTKTYYATYQTATAIDLSVHPLTVGPFASTTIIASGTMRDSGDLNGGLFEGTTVNVTAGKSGTDISNATFPTSVIVDETGAYSIPVTPGASTPSTGYTATPIITVTAPTTKTTYGFSFDVATEGKGKLTDKTIAADSAAVGQLTATEATFGVTVTIPAFGLASDKMSVKYTVNNVAKTTEVAGNATTAVISVAYGSTLNAVSIDTTTKTFTIGTEKYNNAAYEKVTNPATINFGAIYKAQTGTFVDKTVSKTVAVTVTPTPIDTDVGVALEYTNAEGKIAYATIFTPTTAFSSVDMLVGSSFSVYERNYDIYTQSVQAGAISVALERPYTYTINVKGYTIEGADKTLSGMTVKYAITDSAIADPTEEDLDKTATASEGKVEITVGKDKYITYKVVDENKMYSWSISSSVAVVADASATATAIQDGGALGVIKTENGVALSGVKVGYELHISGGRSGNATATVTTNALGLYFIPVKSAAQKLVTYPVLAGYEFHVASHDVATYFESDLNASASTQNVGDIVGAPVNTVGVSSIALMDATSVYSVMTSAGDSITVSAPFENGTVLVLSAPDYYYSALGGNNTQGDSVAKMVFKGWFFNGEKVANIGTNGTFEVTEDGVLEAQYGVEFVSTTPGAGINSTVLIIGIIAVVIALVAVAYVVIQTKKD